MPVIACQTCGTTIASRSPKRKFCSDRCRQRHHRGIPGQPTPEPSTSTSEPAAATSEPGPTTNSTRAWLTSATVTDHPLAAVALRVATALDTDTLAPSERAQLSREYRALLADLKAAAPPRARGALAEIRARRDMKVMP